MRIQTYPLNGSHKSGAVVSTDDQGLLDVLKNLFPGVLWVLQYVEDGTVCLLRLVVQIGQV